MQTSTGKKVAIALGASFSAATLTAFAVAPLAEKPIPSSARIVESIALDPQPIETLGRFQRHATIAEGESLEVLLQRLGGADSGLEQFIRNDPRARRMAELKPGRIVTAEVDASNRIKSITYPVVLSNFSRAAQLDIVRTSGDGWNASMKETRRERIVETRSFAIDEKAESVFAATEAAGIPDAVATQLPEVFSSEIDFHQDTRVGDQIRVVYEVFRDARNLTPDEPGRVLAVEYRGQKRKLDALWFDRADGNGAYYTFDGRALKGRFLRSPVEFSRISSRFTANRMHPVLGMWRAHRGVDYAAPVGTKVLSVGDGIVEFVGTQNGYGKVVTVRHDNEHYTLYAHLSKFPKGLKVGQAIEQGELIGFVGQSGWATGPHLHFEMQVNGEAVDPDTVLPRPAPALQAAERLRFSELAATTMLRLDERNSQIAASSFE